MNKIEFKDGIYHSVAVSNLYRTEDGTRIYFQDYEGNPVWLYSNTPIHIEIRPSERYVEEKD